MLGFRRKRTNLHEKYDYPNLREQLDAVGADGYAPALGEAMRAIGCRNEHETMLTLLDALLQRLDRRRVARAP